MSKKNRMKKVDEATIQAFQADLGQRFDEVLARPDVAGNASLHKKFAAEKNRLMAHAATLAGFGVDPSFVNAYTGDGGRRGYLAIYALQKVSRIIKALSLKSALLMDGYTRAIASNALASEGAISNRLARGSLTRDLKLADEEVLKTRLQKADSTAGTQRSSTAHALSALGIATYDRSTKTLALRSDNAIGKAFQGLFVEEPEAEEPAGEEEVEA
jgi:hypothetical protein